MNDTSRRRYGSRSMRLTPFRLVASNDIRPASFRKVDLVACAAVAIVAFALCTLIWIVTVRTVQEQRGEIRDRAEQAMVGEAATIAETIAHELLMIDQSLTIVQAAWKADSDMVNLDKWQKQMPALTAVADDLFIADDQHIIRQDILPKAIGQGIGSAYVTFPHGSLEVFQSDGTKDKESLLLQADTGAPIDSRQFLMYILRPLDHPLGWLVGASYRSTELTKLFSQAALGINPVVALIDLKRGILQAVVGPAARRPNTDLSRTPLFDVITRSPTGTWIGQTAIDDVERVHAFHQVPDRDMVVLVAENLAEVMEPADALTASAHVLAAVATALVMAIGTVVLWELYTIRVRNRQKRTIDRNRMELDRLRTEETGTTARAHLNAARLQVVLEATTDGIALFDSALRLVEWNHPFSRSIGIVPRKDMPLETLLRNQAAAGLFKPISDIESDIARRVGILRSGDSAGLPQQGPNHEKLTLRGLPIAVGGFILLLNGLPTGIAPLLPVLSKQVDEPVAAEVVSAAPVEW